jgi:hypothetical protein
MHTARGALKLLVCCRAGARKIHHRAAAGRVDIHCHADVCAVVQLQRERALAHALRQSGDGAAHRFFGVVLHVLHVGLHHRQAELVDHAVEFLHAFFVGGNLSLQVGQVLLRVAADGHCVVPPPVPNSSSISASRSTPRSTSLKFWICTPSSSMVVENGGMEPGVMPPMSAWWPRLPT